jgi:hypothetical protein
MNIRPGRFTLWIDCDGSARTPTVDGSWQAIGTAVAALTINKRARIEFWSFGTSDSDIYYTFYNGV